MDFLPSRAKNVLGHKIKFVTAKINNVKEPKKKARTTKLRTHSNRPINCNDS